MPTQEDIYDVVVYPSLPYTDTHPSQLAVMGMLHGLAAAPVEHCRVLEIGCNEGGNLIPMAYAIPGSSFVGFDLAGQPIVRAQQRIEQLGLTNIRLFQADIMDAHDDLGTFDYIIAHGVFAWVPEPVSLRLLALCRKHLAPNGIAFISYNALPGGHLGNLVRDILQQRTAVIDDPAIGITQGIDLLQFLAEARPADDPLRTLMEKQATRLRKREPQVIFHDELAEHYHPVSITTFVTQAVSHGLKYISEATLPASTDPCYKASINTTAQALANGDPLAAEQILDFARMRRYRQTLLCRQECTVTADLNLGNLPLLHFASPAVSSSADATAMRHFALADGTKMESESPATIALMDLLIDAWPASVSFAQLTALLDQQRMTVSAEFVLTLLRLTISKMIHLRAWKVPVGEHVAERPTASAAIRQAFAASDSATTCATTLLHTSFRVEDQLLRHLIALLDGTRDQTALVRALHQQHPEMSEDTLSLEIGPALGFLHTAGVLLDPQDSVDPPSQKPQN